MGPFCFFTHNIKFRYTNSAVFWVILKIIFGCIVREALPIELDKVFVVCSALSVSFVKLMLHACCLEVFTNAKGCLVRMSDYYAKYSGAQINKCGT
jgi:hypothetical protein